ncbi:hypothetical protein DKW60_01205 [Leucothrix pacifica]|uniref:Outer membrane protein assembly factor BamE n=2 Tax=Leucothrix pacifica TaxID=1247513 RepID=A0A317CQ47_9GAMM|nr:hypothetical protein DKW60_01205 [Leucothrix pacifica]
MLYTQQHRSTKVLMDIMKQLILIAILTTLITACSRYQPTILQGNALDSATIAQIKVGMSKADVIQILGSPLMQDDFQTKRWDYLYYSIEQGRKSEQKNLTLEFNGDIVSKIN